MCRRWKKCIFRFLLYKIHILVKTCWGLLVYFPWFKHFRWVNLTLHLNVGWENKKDHAAESMWCDSHNIRKFFIWISVLYSQFWQKKICPKNSKSRNFRKNCYRFPLTEGFLLPFFHRKKLNIKIYEKFGVGSPTRGLLFQFCRRLIF